MMMMMIVEGVPMIQSACALMFRGLNTTRYTFKGGHSRVSNGRALSIQRPVRINNHHHSVCSHNCMYIEIRQTAWEDSYIYQSLVCSNRVCCNFPHEMRTTYKSIYIYRIRDEHKRQKEKGWGPGTSMWWMWPHALIWTICATRLCSCDCPVEIVKLIYTSRECDSMWATWKSMLFFSHHAFYFVLLALSNERTIGDSSQNRAEWMRVKS